MAPAYQEKTILHLRLGDEGRQVRPQSRARALADISHVVPDDELRQAIRESQFLKLFDRAAIEDAVTRRPAPVW